MKWHNLVRRAVAPIGMALVTGCASSLDRLESDTLLPEIDVVQVKEYSEEALKLAQEAKLDVQMLNSKLTEMDNRLILLAEEAQSVSVAKIEELENRLSLLVEAFKDLHEQMAAIEVLPRIRVGGKSTKPAVFNPSDAGTLVTSSEYDHYQQALKVFDEREFSRARGMFDNVLKKFTNGHYSDKAQYWIGECYYAEGDYANAIAAFTKVFSYQRTSKADDAQLKLGLSYLRMGKADLAVAEFQKLVDRYPASEYVPRARKYLADIDS